VGVHVVGSTARHPEMIWATFEHVNNTPNPEYTYTNTAEGEGRQPADGAGNWLFSATGAASSNPGPRMRIDRQNPANIKAVGSGTIGPSNITRLKPWGTASDDTPNNTNVISINKSVSSSLLSGDVRKNYIMIGATWTKGGQPPNDDNQVGTNAMANSTMETFTRMAIASAVTRATTCWARPQVAASVISGGRSSHSSHSPRREGLRAAARGLPPAACPAISTALLFPGFEFTPCLWSPH
jgi:hypothetical protein